MHIYSSVVLSSYTCVLSLSLCILYVAVQVLGVIIYICAVTPLFLLGLGPVGAFYYFAQRYNSRIYIYTYTYIHIYTCVIYAHG